MDNEAEGVWSPDIEHSFHEALSIYPPCGRRKIILSDEGKMYGRNELIARYIKLRTGKTRTRKQVSSHIQVLARRKSREMQSQFKDQATKDKVLQSMASMSSAQIVSHGALTPLASNRLDINQSLQPYPKSAPIWSGVVGGHGDNDIKPFQHANYMLNSPVHPHGNLQQHPQLPQAVNIPAVTSSRQPPITSASQSPFVNPNNSGISVMAQQHQQQQQQQQHMQHSHLVLPQWKGQQIGSHKLRLVNFSAYRETSNQETDQYSKHLFVHIDQTAIPYQEAPLEQINIEQIYDKFPQSNVGLNELLVKGPAEAFYVVKFWADMSVDLRDEQMATYAVSSEYESSDNITLECSTKVCSFGKQVVEKIETEFGRLEKGRYVYRIDRSKMCEYMINFITRLKNLPEKPMMDSVLENFTIQQLLTNRETGEILLCLAYIFQVSTSEHGAQHHLYQLAANK